MRIYAPKWVVIDSAGNVVAGFEDKTLASGYVSTLNFDTSMPECAKPYRVRPNDREWWREAELGD